jgi:hypothetical protein
MMQNIVAGATEMELGAPCPFCGKTATHRRKRRGFVENYIRSLLGYFPWHCGTCKRTFYFRKRNRRHSKKKYVD